LPSSPAFGSFLTETLSELFRSTVLLSFVRSVPPRFSLGPSLLAIHHRVDLKALSGAF